MNLERISLSQLSPDPANARKHSDRNIDAIKASLRRFGQQKPIVVDGDGVVRAGNGTLVAARALGWTELEVVRTPLRGSEAVAFAIADNRTAELAEWESDALQRQLEALSAEGFEMDATGFDSAELERLLASGAPAALGDPDAVPEVEDAEVYVKPGEVYLLGKHRLMCGDSTKREDVARVMAGETADICFTSPPYGQQRDYETGVADWHALMLGVFAALPAVDSTQVLVNLGLIHRKGEWIPYWDAWVEWMRAQGWRRFGWYVWDQGPGLPGDWVGRLAPSHEFIFHFNKESERARKTQKCKHAGALHGPSGLREKDGTVGAYTGAGQPIQETKIPDSVVRIMRHKGGSVDHPAPFPVDLPKFIFEAFSDPGDLEFEPFCGSGTSIIAAEQTRRRCCAIDISPKYVQVAIERWEQLTGERARKEGP